MDKHGEADKGSPSETRPRLVSIESTTTTTLAPLLELLTNSRISRISNLVHMEETIEATDVNKHAIVHYIAYTTRDTVTNME